MADLNIAVVCSSNMNRSMEAHHLLAKRGFNVRSFGSGSQVKLPGLSPDKPNVYDFDTTYDHIYKDLEKMDKAYYTQNGILNLLDRNRRIKPRPERFQDYFSKILVRGNKMAAAGSAPLNGADGGQTVVTAPSVPEKFDVIFTCEERVFDQVVEDLEKRNWDWSGEGGSRGSRQANSSSGATNTANDHGRGAVDNRANGYTNSYQPVHVVNLDITDNQEEATLGAFLFCEICELMRESDDLDNDIDEILTEVEHSSDRTILHTLCFY